MAFTFEDIPRATIDHFNNIYKVVEGKVSISKVVRMTINFPHIVNEANNNTLLEEVSTESCKLFTTLPKGQMGSP